VRLRGRQVDDDVNRPVREDLLHGHRLDALVERVLLMDRRQPVHAGIELERHALGVARAQGARLERPVDPLDRQLPRAEIVFRLVEILSAAVEVPEQDQGNGVTTDYPAPGTIGRQLRIRHAKARPEHATVAVQYRDGWFYIDDHDQATKYFFRLLSTLWSVAVAESAAKSSAPPVLTIPASR